MADTLAARQHGVVQLHGVQTEIPLDRLKPFKRVAGRRLQAQDLEPPVLLITGERGVPVSLGMEQVGERHGGFQRQFRPGPYREMRGGRRVTQKNDVSVMPFLAEHPRKAKPRGSPDMAGIGHQAVTVKMIPEDPLADGDALGLAHVRESIGVKRGLRTLDDKRRGLAVELVGVRPDPAPVSLLENKGERVIEPLVRA